MFGAAANTITFRSIEVQHRMPTRRQFFGYTAGVSAGSIALVAADARLTRHCYEEATRELWREPLTRVAALCRHHVASVGAHCVRWSLADTAVFVAARVT